MTTTAHAQTSGPATIRMRDFGPQSRSSRTAASPRARRVLFVITEDWYFCSHYLERALALQAAGVEVGVATRLRAHADVIRNAGFRAFPIEFNRQGLNPLRELRCAAQLQKIVREFAPDICHHVALKPIVIGTLVARWLGGLAVVNAPTGMGYVFTSTALKARLLRPIAKTVLRWLLNPKGSKVIIQNKDDLRTLISWGCVAPENAFLVRGAGVNVARFHPKAEPLGQVVITLVARMLKDKGIHEFVMAARMLKSRGITARFRLVGAPDSGNPSTLDHETLSSLSEEGVIEWAGHLKDVRPALDASHIVCLPSYREGMPKALLEAAAAGLPLVSTDVPGCREIVRHGVNGLLVPARDATALAAALETLIRTPALRVAMGAASRRLVVQEFSSAQIIRETKLVYEDVLGKREMTGRIFPLPRPLAGGAARVAA